MTAAVINPGRLGLQRRAFNPKLSMQPARSHTLPLPCLVASTAFLMASATLPLASSALVALNLACRQLKKRF